MLETSGAALIEGAKWCGKTLSSLQAANNVVYMQDPDEGPGYMAMVDGVEKDSEKVRVLLQSLARNISTLATAKTIIGDMQASLGMKQIDEAAENLLKLKEKVDVEK